VANWYNLWQNGTIYDKTVKFIYVVLFNNVKYEIMPHLDNLGCHISNKIVDNPNCPFSECQLSLSTVSLFYLCTVHTISASRMLIQCEEW
jgi:hypothetical protein